MALPEKIHIPAEVFAKLIIATELQFNKIKTANNLGNDVRRMSMEDFRNLLLAPARHFVEDWTSRDNEVQRVLTSINYQRYIDQMDLYDFRFFSEKLKTKFSEDTTRTEKIQSLNRLLILDYYDVEFTYEKSVTYFNNVQVDGIIDMSWITKPEGSGWIVCIDSILGNFNIENSKIRGQSSSFKFKNCTTGSFKIYKSEIGDFEFIRCPEIAIEEGGKIEILGSETGYFQFRACKVGEIRIHRKSETGYFRVAKSKVEGIELANSSAEYFRIKDDSKIGNFIIRNGSTADSFSLEKSDMLDFVFESGTFRILTFDSSNLNKFSIRGSNKFDIFISGGEINSLILKECILGLETSISISDTQIFYLQMVKFAVVGNLFLRNVSPLSAVSKFNSWTAEWNDVFKRVDEDNKKNLPQIPTFLLYHSSLGKTEFTNCGLEGFKLNYSNSNLLDTFIVGGNLPIFDIQIVTKIEVDKDKNETLVFADENKTESPYQKASFFNQFKKVLERAGNTYGSSLLQSEWADNQLKYLKLVKKEKLKAEKRGTIRSIFKRIIGFWIAISSRFKKKMENNQINQDILSFRLNKYSNNHDENWLIALGWIVVFSVLFYLLFLWASGRLFIDTAIDWGLFGNYLEFLNPLHNSNFLNDKIKPEGGIIAIDVVAKLIMGFLIYKFLRAFRKYGKK
jgi:hypothetical protein